MANTLDLKALQKRAVSALVMGVPAFAMIWAGGIWIVTLIFAFLTVALLEWFRLAGRIGGRHEKAVLLAGSLYILLTAYAFYILGLPGWNQGAFALIALVVCSDVGAYFTGKLVGGPKLLEQVSPNKTWAGFAGSIAGAMFAACLCWPLGLHIDSWVFALAGGVVIGITGQVGDLIISFAKRQAGVKDTGGLIPGHGGLLDRIDSLLLSAPVFLMLSLLLSHGQPT